MILDKKVLKTLSRYELYYLESDGSWWERSYHQNQFQIEKDLIKLVNLSSSTLDNDFFLRIKFTEPKPSDVLDLGKYFSRDNKFANLSIKFRAKYYSIALGELNLEFFSQIIKDGKILLPNTIMASPYLLNYYSKIKDSIVPNEEIDNFLLL